MPSQFDITSASLQRLIKEERSYHDELEQQKARIAKLERDTNGNNENLEYQIKQERQAVEETRNVLPSLKTRIAENIDKMEKLLEESKRTKDGPTVDSINKAKEAISSAKSSLREIP